MPANLTNHTPMGSVQDISGNTPFTGSLPELAGQTFFLGVPVQLAVSGFVQKWDGTTVAGGILGISLIPASNLPSNGKGAPGLLSQVGAPGATGTYGNVTNMPGAINIALGQPMTDGRTLFEQANADTIFEGQFDNSAGTVPADYTPTLAMIGKNFGITFDASGTAYVDGGKTVDGTSTVVKIVGLNPNNMVQAGTPNVYLANTLVRFQFLQSARQLSV